MQSQVSLSVMVEARVQFEQVWQSTRLSMEIRMKKPRLPARNYVRKWAFDA